MKVQISNVENSKIRKVFILSSLRSLFCILLYLWCFKKDVNANTKYIQYKNILYLKLFSVDVLIQQCVDKKKIQ